MNSGLAMHEQSADLAELWFYRMFGEEFGPVPFVQLKEYAEKEQIKADDEVKFGANGMWRRVGSIGRLMAVIPYKPVEKTIVPTSPKSNSHRLEQRVTDNFKDSIAATEQRRDDPERVRSVVRNSAEPTTIAPVPPAIPDANVAVQSAYETAKANIAASIIAQAEAGFKGSEEQAMAQVAWASAPNVDRHWWGWASGVEFGPVEFAQVFGLARTGQLKPTDLVRNGEFGQFGPSSSVPGLFNAVAMIARAAETHALAKSQAQATVALALQTPTVAEDVPNLPSIRTAIPPKRRTPPAGRTESAP